MGILTCWSSWRVRNPDFRTTAPGTSVWPRNSGPPYKPSLWGLACSGLTGTRFFLKDLNELLPNQKIENFTKEKHPKEKKKKNIHISQFCWKCRRPLGTRRTFPTEDKQEQPHLGGAWRLQVTPAPTAPWSFSGFEAEWWWPLIIRFTFLFSLNLSSEKSKTDLCFWFS